MIETIFGQPGHTSEISMGSSAISMSRFLPQWTQAALATRFVADTNLRAASKDGLGFRVNSESCKALIPKPYTLQAAGVAQSRASERGSLQLRRSFAIRPPGPDWIFWKIWDV